MDGGISCPGKEGVISIQGGASRVGGAPCIWFAKHVKSML